ncbi:DUF2752 domain-containing protein [Brachybacterium sp. FME24]|uniref:DUF2752 domain-containing protein n=1 Tax=Brachybacterium sp. FME24 TaxID=2742605 RepID=UPI001865B7EB|nr:DUF2752 domain-containing protein [Brachybacterium sp. FME24]
MTSAVRDQRGIRAQEAPARGLRRVVLPVGLAVGGVAVALIVQLVFDPFRTDIPLCVVYHLTGLHCPGCGAIRSVHALLAGDLLLALRSNVLIAAALPLTVAGFAVWTVRRARGWPTNLLPSQRVAYVLVAVIAVFTVLRNLSAFWFLAPISLVGA